MAESNRTQRLQQEKQVLDALDQASTILTVGTEGDPPVCFRIKFAGKGLKRSHGVISEAEVVELHECELRIPSRFPIDPPDIRWLTPILHPNISLSGFLAIGDLGLEWDKSLGLDVIVERLWDMTRLARVDLDEATNVSAKKYLENDSTWSLPLDTRVLRDLKAPNRSNIIRYRPRGDSSAGTFGVVLQKTCLLPLSLLANSLHQMPTSYRPLLLKKQMFRSNLQSLPGRGKRKSPTNLPHPTKHCLSWMLNRESREGLTDGIKVRAIWTMMGLLSSTPSRLLTNVCLADVEFEFCNGRLGTCLIALRYSGSR